MDYCPHCGERLVKVEQTSPRTFKATDQDTGADVPIPAEVVAAYVREGRVPLSYACQKGWPFSYRGVPGAYGDSSRSGAQHVNGLDHHVRAGELPGEIVRTSHLRSVDPFNPDVDKRTVRVQ